MSEPEDQERGKEKIVLDAPVATNSSSEAFMVVRGPHSTDVIPISPELLAEAEDRGYRRAIEALRDEAAWTKWVVLANRDDAPYDADTENQFAADFLEHAAAARSLRTLAPPHTGPRTWQMPEIPPEVKRVRDREGGEWERVVDGWVLLNDDPTLGIGDNHLIEECGPLTEVPDVD